MCAQIEKSYRTFATFKPNTFLTKWGLERAMKHKKTVNKNAAS
jgi:hypothetical protein